jgi:tryptophan synthase alpha chain
VRFGISRPEHVAALNGSADGVVVGSAIVAVIGEETDDSRRVEAVRTLVQALRGAMVT